MHSWVFRHRVRLRVVFGTVRPDPATAAGPGSFRPPKAPPGGEAPGTVLRRARYTLIYPMPRPA
ncbi:MAG: hypothetical protein QF903_03850 [Planctomycetota bacterium]|nr:hypothetical protein [Planctomycetota bacterium]MDP6762166.1 hypothetical protein [Planctomycetota bacterium]MDP6988591.1 hypothetical protein [Planctomycetota bacterium]